MLIPLKTPISIQEEGSHANQPQVQKAPLQLQLQLYIHTYYEESRKKRSKTDHPSNTISIMSTH